MDATAMDTTAMDATAINGLATHLSARGGGRPARQRRWPDLASRRSCWCAGARAARAALGRALVVVLLLAGVLLAPAAAWADGAELFGQHCAGCHVHGGNIIRRGKTLRLAALERQQIASPEAIARIAAGGVGQMGGYGDVLGEAGVQQVAEWVWQQAQLGWP